MGAEPWTALAIASVPYATARKMHADLSAMLQGATEILRADGCALVGGHSAEASEMGLGFSVTGLADSGKILRKSGLQPDDQLILTKPLGTGIVLAGHMRGNVRAQWLIAAIELDAHNQRPRRPDRDDASSARWNRHHRLWTGRPSARDAGGLRPRCGAAAGGNPRAARRTRPRRAWDRGSSAPENRLLFGDAPETALLVDPQTSGGLLLGLPPSRATACLQALLDNGLNAAIIGEVEPAREHAPRIRLESCTAIPGRYYRENYDPITQAIPVECLHDTAPITGMFGHPMKSRSRRRPLYPSTRRCGTGPPRGLRSRYWTARAHPAAAR